MKKLSTIFAAALFVALSFVSCKKDDGGGGSAPSPFDGTIRGTLVNIPAGTGNFTIDAWFENNQGSTPDASGTVNSDGSFEFSLPTPSADMLYPVGEGFASWAKISDTNVLSTGIIVEGWSGSIHCVSNDNPVTRMMMFLYVDNDVTVRGSMSANGSSASIDVNLKKGWNKVLATATTTSGSVTTGTVPSDLVWRSQTDMDMSLFGD